MAKLIGMKRGIPYVLLFVLLPIAGTSLPQEDDTQYEAMTVPDWAKDAVWYQIFVERFRNGDQANDPTPHDIFRPGFPPAPEGWRTTPWTQDWYEMDNWATVAEQPFYRMVQLRRYGGDLQGLLDRLDYLSDLGVTALYLNPINDAPSLHKFDARNWRHIDRNFGPTPRRDEALIATEDPLDPSTWVWTGADSLFLALVDALHARDMRIIVDFSWNHTGTSFWAWRDILENQEQSPYASWYDINRFDDPTTEDLNEFDYDGWNGVKSLPEIRKVDRPEGIRHGPIEGNLTDPVKQHVFHVTRRWLDPNGDGDPSDGIDGFRLDVAEKIPMGFWREYRQHVRSINPEAYLVAELWWDQWPEKMTDPSPWLQGDMFDASMNYRWYMPTRGFFTQAPPDLTPSQYVAHLDSIDQGIPLPVRQVMMNFTASHDSPRFATSIYNDNPYKYQGNARNEKYRLEKPDEQTRTMQELILVQQFTYIGAPQIWNGDEVGMWGADDPDCRKPVVWDDLTYEDEVAHPFGRARRRDAVAPDMELLDLFKRLIALRKQHMRLFADGSLNYTLVDDERRLLAYERTLGEKRAIVAFNVSSEDQLIRVSAADGTYQRAHPSGPDISVEGGALQAELPAMTARVWILH